MSAISRIKDWFKKTFGGSSSSSSRSARTVSNYGGGGSRSYSSTSRYLPKEPIESKQQRMEREAKERKAKQDATTKALASTIDKKAKDVESKLNTTSAKATTGVDRVIKKMGERAKPAPPDPKIAQAQKSREDATKALRSLEKVTAKPERRMTGTLAGAKIEAERNPVATMAARKIVNGALFNVPDLVTSKMSLTGDAQDVEKMYRRNVEEHPIIAGASEMAGSLVGFGATNALSKEIVGNIGGKALAKGAEKATAKLASSSIARKAAERELEVAVKEGAVHIADEAMRKQLLERFSTNWATRIMEGLGADAAVNMTTGAVSDISRASEMYEPFSKEWWDELRKSAELNLALGGIATVLPEATIKTGLPFRRRLRGETLDAIENVGNARRGLEEITLRNGRRLDGVTPPPKIGQSLDDTIAKRATQTAEENALERARIDSAPMRRTFIENANEADEALNRMPVAVGDAFRTSTIDPNATNVSIRQMANVTNAVQDARRQRTLDDLLFRARANEVPQGRRDLSELVNIRNADDVARQTRLSELDAELDAVQREILLKRNTAPQEELDALTTRFDDLLAERRALEAPAPTAEEAVEQTARTAESPRMEEEVTPPPLREEPIAPKATERYESVRNAEREQGLGTGKFKEEPAPAPKQEQKPKPQTKRQAENVDDFATVNEDTSNMGFAKGGDEVSTAKTKVAKEASEATTNTKSAFEKQRDAAYKQGGVDLNTDNVEHMNVGEQKEIIDKNFRTTEEHTKRGYTTIAVTGDKGFKGVIHKALDAGETIVDVYHDKENLAKGAQRVMAKADKEGGVQSMIKQFNDYAEGKLKMSSKEVRDQLYDVLAAVDFANANKDQDWAEDLFLSACKAGAEQTSVSGLSLRMWQKMAMSSPEYRAKAVRQQILEMINKSAGFRKSIGKAKGNKITMSELDTVLKDNPALKKTLDELENMKSATSVDEVQKVADKALLQVRRSLPMTAFDQLTQWRYVAMLSSPKTHVRNITSNIYSATLGQLRDGMASGIEDGLVKNGKLEAALKKKGLSMDDYMKSTGKMSASAWKDSHVGVMAGTELNGLKSRLKHAQLELESLAPDSKEASDLTKRISDLESTIKTKQADYDKLVGDIKRPTAKKAQEAWLTDGFDKLVTNAEKYEKRVYTEGVGKGIFKMNDKASKLISNALETSDAVSLERIFRERYDKILTANNWEELSKAAQGTGKEAKAAAARLKKIEEYAAQEASYIAAMDTYRNYNALSEALSKYVADSVFNYDAPLYKKVIGGVIHATMPFTKVPVNLMKRAIDYSPAGLLSGKKALNDAINAGNITEINRACERLAEGRIGTGVAVLGAALGFVDPDGMMINTRLDKNDLLDKRKKDAGYQDYSVQAFGRNITMDWLTPTSATLFTGVTFGRLIRELCDTIAGDNGMEFDVSKMTDVPINLVSSLLEPSLQLSVFQGVNSMLEDVVESDNYSQTNANPWVKMGVNIFGNYAKSMMPTVLGQISRAIAPYDYFVTGDTDTLYGINSTLAKLPIVSNKLYGAKTNSWGQIKNEKTSKADYAASLAKNLLSPANINKTTWDETDEQMMELSKSLGDEIFPKNNYNKDLAFGRNNGDIQIKMSNKELSEYNVARGKSGSDAMADALNTVVFNRFDKDEKGHRTIPHADNITDAERERLVKQYDGKGIKDVVSYIINTESFKKATPAEQKQVIKAIYGTNSDSDSNESKGAKRFAERTIAGKHGISADEYDYYNEVPRNAQEALAPFIESGVITYKQALDFKRGAGKTYYATDERGEKGGTVTTHYNKKEMLAYLESVGYSEDEAAALYNAFKTSTAKEYGASSSRSGYRRRGGYRRYGSRGGSSKKAKVPTPKTIKASQLVKGQALVSKKSSSSAKATAPTLKRVEAKIDLPKVKR